MNGNDRTWWARTPEERQVDLERLRDAVARSGTVESSAGHEVTVAVGPGGALTSVVISTAGMRLTGRALGAVIADTVTLATARATAAMAERIGEVTGGRGYVAGVTAALPDPVDESAVPSVPVDEDAEDGDLESRFRVLAEETREQLRGYAQARQELAERSFSAHSADRTVRATVAANGTVTGIDIEDDAFRSGASILGNRVYAAIQQARARAAAATAARIQQVPGARLNLADLMPVPEEAP